MLHGYAGYTCGVSRSGPQERALLQRLHESHGTEDIIAAARAIGAARAIEPLPSLLKYVLNPRYGRIVPVAAQAIREALEHAPPASLVDIDRRVRLVMRDSSRERLVPDSTTFAAEDAWAVFGLASSHPNGFVREAAVRSLDAIDSGSEVPFLILRMNDWVKPIRSLARDAMDGRLRVPKMFALVDAMPLLLRLSAWKRDKHDSFVRSVLRLLRTDECRAAREHGLASRDALVRREIFALSLGVDPNGARDVLSRAMADPDGSNRLWAAEKLRSHRTFAGWSDLLRLARHDRFVPVRRDALITYAKHDQPAAEAVFQEALLDPHPAVRRLARRSMDRLGGPSFDARAFYQASLAAPTDDTQRLRGAILGLGEAGTPEDVALLLPLLEHPLTRVRRSVVRAIGALDVEGQVGTLATALRSDRLGVSNEAARVLARWAQSPLVPEVLSETAADEGAPLHSRRNAQRALDRAG